MLQELRSVFPEFIFLDALSLRDFNQYELDFDIVFSPMHIMTPKKLYITKTILTAQEKHELRQHVFGQLNNTMETEIQVEKMISAIREHATIHNESELFKIVKAQFEDTYAYSSVKASTLSINSTLNLQDLLPTNHINFVERVADIGEAIQLTANPLVRMKYVDPLYVDKMHAAFDDTYMVINQNIAIPHADGDQVVHRTAMSMLILKEPLELSTGLKVHIFVAIAATDKFKHLRPLLQLRDMSQDDKAIQQIVQTDSKIDVYKIIQHFSKID